MYVFALTYSNRLKMSLFLFASLGQKRGARKCESMTRRRVVLYRCACDPLINTSHLHRHTPSPSQMMKSRSSRRHHLFIAITWILLTQQRAIAFSWALRDGGRCDQTMFRDRYNRTHQHHRRQHCRRRGHCRCT